MGFSASGWAVKAGWFGDQRVRDEHAEAQVKARA